MNRRFTQKCDSKLYFYLLHNSNALNINHLSNLIQYHSNMVKHRCGIAVRRTRKAVLKAYKCCETNRILFRVILYLM